MSPPEFPHYRPQQMKSRRSQRLNKPADIEINMIRNGPSDLERTETDGNTDSENDSTNETASDNESTNSQPENPDRLARIEKLLHDTIAPTMKEMRRNIREIKDDRALEPVRDRITKLEVENTELKTKVTTLEDRIDSLEAYSRQYNLYFYNIPTTAALEVTIRKIMTNMGVPFSQNMIFDIFHRTKPFRADAPKPVIVRFIRQIDRNNVWDRRRKLKSTTYILATYQKQRDQLRPVVTAAIFQGGRPR